jgi:hypothetical protein
MTALWLFAGRRDLEIAIPALSPVGTFFFKKVFTGMSIVPALVRRRSRKVDMASVNQRRKDDACYGDGQGDEGL